MNDIWLNPKYFFVMGNTQARFEQNKLQRLFRKKVHCKLLAMEMEGFLINKMVI